MRFRFIAFSCPSLLHSLPAGKTLFLCFAVTEPYRGTGPQAPVGSAVPPHYGGQVTSGAVKCSHLSWSDKTLKPQARPSLTVFRGEINRMYSTGSGSYSLAIWDPALTSTSFPGFTLPSYCISSRGRLIGSP